MARMILERLTNTSRASGVDDQVDITLAITLLHVAETMPLVRQRAQRFGQQAQYVGLHRQLAGLGAGQYAFGSHDVAHVPALERFVARAQRPGLKKQLQAPAHVLDLDEAGLAHHALGHEATGHAHATRQRFELLRGPCFRVGVLGEQVAGIVDALEVVREGDAFGAQGFQLAAALGDQVILVDSRKGFVGHCCCSSFPRKRESSVIDGSIQEQSRWIPASAGIASYAASLRLEPASRPAFRLASTNSSRSPSSTFCVSERSIPVRRSLMRD
jgi:hypothetical protein